MAAFIIALHVLGWGTLVKIVAPQHLKLGGTVFGLGIGVTAYVLGMRHAFDADHIAAIDNSTRRLMGRSERPVSVGFWFALGHSTIVFALVLLIAVGARAVPRQLLTGGSEIRSTFSVIGTGVSVCFLYAIASLNFATFLGNWRLFERMRGGHSIGATLDEQLRNGGFVTRLVARVGRPVERPWHMYVVGLLFGLGFDTATEIALLAAAGTRSAAGVPWYAILCLPVLFAAGMSLFDTLDGTFMNVAYGWSLSRPLRKAYYNLTITGFSVAVAVVIGTVELLGLLRGPLGLHHGLLGSIADVDLGAVGFIIVGLFVLSSGCAPLVWRYAQVEQGRPVVLQRPD